MAITLVDTTTDGPGGTTATTRAAAKSAGLADGDVVLLWCCNGGSATTPTAVPSGFIELATIGAGSSAGNTLYRKVITSAAGEPSTWQVTFDASHDAHGVRAEAWRGVDGTTPEDVSPGTTNNASSTTPVCSALTPVTESTKLVLGAVHRANTTFTWPAGTTESVQEVGGGASSDRALGTANRDGPASGVSSGTTTITMGAAGATGTISVLLRQASGPALEMQSIWPDADTVTTGWTTTPLFSKINDESDATVISSTAA